MEVWDTPGDGFGDIWATLQFLLRKSEASKRPVLLSRRPHGQDILPRAAEMLSLIDTPADIVVQIDEGAPTAHVHMNVWAARYFPTKVRWVSPPRGLVTYQFDGRSSAHLKNPPPEEEKAFFSWCVDNRIQPIPVGAHISMAECVRLMSMSEGHVGVCSGMATLAHSVGVPTYILEYGIKVAWWHGSNPITVCAGVAELKAKFLRTP